jgi:hypothetical protein
MKKQNRLYRIVVEAIDDRKSAIQQLVGEYELDVKKEESLFDGEVHQWIIEMDRSMTDKVQRNVRKNNGEIVALTNKQRREFLGGESE